MLAALPWNSFTFLDNNESEIKALTHKRCGKKVKPGVHIPPTELRRGEPTYARPNIPPSNFKSVNKCARQKSL